ncbi:MAG: rhodanese-like domain-containing protein [Clostridiales bacterium]|nr:rhodanese-like domain-containing protein [Clostridiales bacterium]
MKNRNLIIGLLFGLIAVLSAATLVVALISRNVESDPCGHEELVQVILVDVRGATEFADGHLPGAVNIEVGYLVERLQGHENTPIMLYCLRGVRSQLAFELLIHHGFIHAMNIGGLDDIIVEQLVTGN